MMGMSATAHKTPLHLLDGRTKLIALMVVFILALLFTSPWYVLGLLALVLVTWGIARLPWTLIRDIMKFFLVIAVIILVVQVFFYPGETNLFRLSKPIDFIGFSGYITLEGIMFGVAMVLRLVVIMIVAPLLVLTTPLPEFILALVKLKVPYRFAFIMTTALSLLPSIQSHSAIIQQAQLCRGIGDFDTGKLMIRLRGISGLLIPLILGTFRDSQTLDVAMSSRAFGAPGKRTFLMESHFRPVDFVIVILAILMLLGGIALRLLGYGTL